jgi:hypothetical protein
VIECKIYIAVILGLNNVLEPDNILVAAQCLFHQPKAQDGVAQLQCTCITCKYMISLNVRCASVAFLNASKHFFSAITALDRFSIAFQTIP